MRVIIKDFVTAALVVGVCAGSVLLAYLFRTEKFDNQYLGLMEVKYRWGRQDEVRLDSNRDGSIDARGNLGRHVGCFGIQESLTDYWEDRNLDGIFEIHFVKDEAAATQYVELDEDADGNYDTLLTGDEAADFFQSDHPLLRNGVRR